MTGTQVLLSLLLIGPVAVAQHSGGSAGGSGHASGTAGARSGPMHSAGPGVVRGTNRGFTRGGPVFGSGFGRYRGRGNVGYGLGYGWPYFPVWDYSSAEPLPYDDEFAGPEGYPLAGNLLIPPAAGTAPAPPPTPASSVVHDYQFGTAATSPAAEPATFTIVLKDGSTRQAVASWVAGGKLHYVDSQDRQPVLSPQLIDRDATERANRAKNLQMELPPG